jgi:hypothetical protein
MTEHPVLKWWHVGVAALVVAVGYGSLLADVSTLKERVNSLEERTDSIKQLRTGKGDLCSKMLDQLVTINDEARTKMMWQRWDALGCENKVPANSTVPENEAGSLGHEL